LCGDLDEDGGLEDMLYARYRSHAEALLKSRTGASARARTDDIPAYMDGLFADALSRCLRDGDAAEEARRYELLAAQPVVFARLAGFLAAHASPQEDPLRKVMEALMHGYAEAEQIEPDHGHDHDHHHDDGGHGHGHHHHDHHH
jgi:hypothetical protein